MSRGIVLIAIGSAYEMLYVQEAYTAAVAIKSNCNINVTLLTHGDTLLGLEPEQQSIFDNIIYIPDEYLTGVRGHDVFRVKLFLDKLTPCAKTLYMDADTIWNNDHSLHDFISQLEGISFTCANRGRLATISDGLKSRWTDLSKINELFGFHYVYDISSEVVYFEKTEVFKEARIAYDNLNIDTNKFGKGFPDEVFLLIGIEKAGIKLHESPWYPSYWQPHYFNDRVQAKPENEIRKFKLLSLGGAFTAQNVKRLYMNMAGAAYFKMGIKRYPYYPENKSKVLQERRMI